MPRPVLETLNHLGAGTLMDDAAEKLAKAVLAVDATGKPAKMTITIHLRKATANALAVTGDVAVKMPSEPKIEALLFPTPEGNLLTEDPRQSKLPLRAVDYSNTDARSIDATATELKTISA
jgi:hypothetical protein